MAFDLDFRFENQI